MDVNGWAPSRVPVSIGVPIQSFTATASPLTASRLLLQLCPTLVGLLEFFLDGRQPLHRPGDFLIVICIPVPNRYFGVFQDGSVKYRGIEARRHDTPLWVKQVQLEMLDCLAQARTLDEAGEYLPKALGRVEQAKRELKARRVPPEQLLVTQKFSRAVEAYKSPSPSARAAGQLQAAGKTVAPGQYIRFIYTRGPARVRAWDLHQDFDPGMVDVQRYCTLLERAAQTILELHQPIHPSFFSYYFFCPAHGLQLSGWT